jgi:hypothetical protein
MVEPSSNNNGYASNDINSSDNQEYASLCHDHVNVDRNSIQEPIDAMTHGYEQYNDGASHSLPRYHTSNVAMLPPADETSLLLEEVARRLTTVARKEAPDDMSSTRVRRMSSTAGSEPVSRLGGILRQSRTYDLYNAPERTLMNMGSSTVMQSIPESSSRRRKRRTPPSNTLGYHCANDASLSNGSDVAAEDFCLIKSSKTSDATHDNHDLAHHHVDPQHCHCNETIDVFIEGKLIGRK